MPELLPNLAPEDSLILAIDTPHLGRAEDLVSVARNSGAWVVKFGLELITSVGTKECAELAVDYGLAWVADAKLFDIPNTVAKTVDVYSKLSRPPVGITIATKSGSKSLEAAEKVASEYGITMLGVTHLTSNDDQETQKYEKVLPRTVVWRESRRAVGAGIGGLVCSAEEVGMVKRFRKTNSLLTMIPGTRSEGAETHDQKRSTTPEAAYQAGADLLVIGREVTENREPTRAYELIVENLYGVKRTTNVI